jgi:hypothetical protein
MCAFALRASASVWAGTLTAQTGTMYRGSRHASHVPCSVRPVEGGCGGCLLGCSESGWSRGDGDHYWIESCIVGRSQIGKTARDLVCTRAVFDCLGILVLPLCVGSHR